MSSNSPGTIGAVAAVLAAAPAVDQITRPHGTTRGIRTERHTITERAARVALARLGVGGGLQGHRVDNGWLFSPFSMFIAGTQCVTWLVTHDGECHDMSDLDNSPIVRG